MPCKRHGIRAKQHAAKGWRICLSFVFLFCAAAVSCAQDEEPPPSDPVTLYVSAPSSLRLPLTNAAKEYSSANPLVSIVLNFASLPVLEEQIRLGSQIDIIVSDMKTTTDRLVANSLLDSESKADLFTNSVVLFAPKGNPLNYDSFFSLAGEGAGNVAIGDPERQASGYYAKQALFYMSLDTKLAGRLIVKESAGDALRSVENGECSSGVGFFSDVYDSDTVSVIDIAQPNTYSDLVYSVAAVAASHAKEDSASFCEWLSSPAALEGFYRYGYKALP
ncbi:MAG: molybdate ABC transporter substrate-binding protein [Eubacteriaceae bacterium]|jgi:molybdate transport system substrate-binding protein|nr:molybdate ABC transporter substrate-binding protein [Eubacteriaceae bacterium]